jgi:hypothetical protein
MLWLYSMTGQMGLIELALVLPPGVAPTAKG